MSSPLCSSLPHVGSLTSLWLARQYQGRGKTNRHLIVGSPFLFSFEYGNRFKFMYKQVSVGGTELDTWVYCHLWMNLGFDLHRCPSSGSTDLGLNFAETILSS